MACEIEERVRQVLASRRAGGGNAGKGEVGKLTDNFVVLSEN
jgi:hypothetical protein